ncbi:MAG: response regulator [Bryobacteraceae bacterium]|jgi:Flp pilus assembly CpaE family ATPase
MTSGTKPGEAPVRVLLIEDNPGDAGLVRAMLAESLGARFIVEWVQSLQNGRTRLGLGEVDIVLLDLSLPDSQGLGGLTAVRSIAPNVPVVIMTGFANQDIAQQAVRLGAQDYLVKGAINGDALARILHYAILRQRHQTAGLRSESQAALGKVVGFLGAKGGVGTTSIACHFGLELKQRTGGRVLLVDLDVAGGSIGFLMKAASEHTLQEVANNLERLDEHFWNKMVITGPEGLEILLSEHSSHFEGQANPEKVRPVFEFTRSIYQWIVVDLGRLNPFVESLVPDLSDLFLVVTLDVVVLYEVERLVTRLTEAGLDRSRMHLIVNQTPKRPDVSPAELGKRVGLGVYAALPECRSELWETYTMGKLMSPKSNFRQQIGQLAEKVAGLKPK